MLPGIVAIQADSHTPGQTAFKITLGSDQLLYVADITNNPMVFARHPGWSASFDMDPALSVATRNRILDKAAEENIKLFFFPASFSVDRSRSQERQQVSVPAGLVAWRRSIVAALYPRLLFLDVLSKKSNAGDDHEHAQGVMGGHEGGIHSQLDGEQAHFGNSAGHVSQDNR